MAVMNFGPCRAAWNDTGSSAYHLAHNVQHTRISTMRFQPTRFGVVRYSRRREKRTFQARRAQHFVISQVLTRFNVLGALPLHAFTYEMAKCSSHSPAIAMYQLAHQAYKDCACA